MSAGDQKPAKRGGVGRRLLLVGSPVVVTLASRSALATGVNHMCTNSVLASLALNPNVSHHAGTTPSNCGVTHTCWKDHQSTQCKPNVWDGCKSYDAYCSITTCLGMSGTNWKVKDGYPDDLYSGLRGQVMFVAKKKNTTNKWLDCTDTTFVKECIAAICNADAWGPDHFDNRSRDTVRYFLKTNVWNKTIDSNNGQTPASVCSQAKSILSGWNNS